MRHKLGAKLRDVNPRNASRATLDCGTKGQDLLVGKTPADDLKPNRQTVRRDSGRQGQCRKLGQQVEGTGHVQARAELSRLIQVLQRHVQRLDSEIEHRIGKEPDLCRKAEILTSIPGIGPTTAAALIS